MQLEDKFLIESKLIHTLIYGPGKVRKTWWAGTAAEAGYNVTFFYSDREGGINILDQIPQEFRKNIRVIDIKDRLDRPVAAHFIARFCKGEPFLWDEKDKKVIFAQSSIDPDHHHVWIDPRKLNSNDVIVKDSWKSFVDSATAQFNSENHVDPSAAERIDWEGYRWLGAVSTWVLNSLGILPCHLIVVGHQQQFEKTKSTKKKGKNNKPYTETIVLWSRMQPQSTSGAHSQTLAQAFDDVLYFYFEGSSVKISTEAVKDRDGGSSIIAPQIFNWGDLKFKKICELAGTSIIPELGCDAFKDFKPGDEIDLDKLQPKHMSFANKSKAASAFSQPVVLDAKDAAKPTTSFAILAQQKPEVS